jgi:hypothetical protein
MPFTDPTPAGLEETFAPPDLCGGTTALPFEFPCVHTPGNRVGDVPHGQPSAAAGEATTTGPAAKTTAHPTRRIPRFTVAMQTSLSNRSSRPVPSLVHWTDQRAPFPPGERAVGR